ncbi:ribose 5-phosphate isomerase B [bacterium]|nr:ribose 5-phosphate isomerase B [bacterium]
MTIAIGCDHGGYALKTILVPFLEQKGITVRDAGAHSTEIVRYPYYAAEVARAVARGEADRGILICSTGIGMSMIANKFKGIRAALCTDTYMAKMTRAHNDANILCLGGRITGDMLAMDIVETWLATPYEGGRHDISLGLIRDAETAMTNGEPWEPKGTRR